MVAMNLHLMMDVRIHIMVVVQTRSPQHRDLIMPGVMRQRHVNTRTMDVVVMVSLKPKVQTIMAAPQHVSSLNMGAALMM